MSMSDQDLKQRQASTQTGMWVMVNGERTEVRADMLAGLLEELGYGLRKVATALNGDFVPEKARNTTRLAAGDAVEIVAPRQGG